MFLKTKYIAYTIQNIISVLINNIDQIKVKKNLLSYSETASQSGWSMDFFVFFLKKNLIHYLFNFHRS